MKRAYLVTQAVIDHKLALERAEWAAAQAAVTDDDRWTFCLDEEEEEVSRSESMRQMIRDLEALR
jgi:hypothetical protein